MVPLRPLSRARIGATTRVVSIRASTSSSICLRATVQPERSSRWAGWPITTRGSCVALHKRAMRSLRMDIGTAASTRSHPRNFDKMCARPKRCSKMSVVPRSRDSARRIFRFAPVANGRSTSCSKKAFATTPASSRFVVPGMAIVLLRSCRTWSIVRRARCASCRSPRPRGTARASLQPAAHICVTCRSASSATAFVNTRTLAFRPRSICIRGNWIPTSRGFRSGGSPRRATTAASRARVRAWSNCWPSSASPRRRDA